MSTFTNILQQKINNLEAQIRQLQEQNARLRYKARWLMETAASSDMSMLPQPEVQDMPQTPSGQYGGNADRYIMSSSVSIPWHPETDPSNIPERAINKLQKLLKQLGASVYSRMTISYHNGTLLIVWPDGSWTTFGWNGQNWVPNYHNPTGQEGQGQLVDNNFNPWTRWIPSSG